MEVGKELRKQAKKDLIKGLLLILYLFVVCFTVELFNMDTSNTIVSLYLLSGAFAGILGLFKYLAHSEKKYKTAKLVEEIYKPEEKTE